MFCCRPGCRITIFELSSLSSLLSPLCRHPENSSCRRCFLPTCREKHSSASAKSHSQRRQLQREGELKLHKQIFSRPTGMQISKLKPKFREFLKFSRTPTACNHKRKRLTNVRVAMIKSNAILALTTRSSKLQQSQPNTREIPSTQIHSLCSANKEKLLVLL